MINLSISVIQPLNTNDFFQNFFDPYVIPILTSLDTLTYIRYNKNLFFSLEKKILINKNLKH